MGASQSQPTRPSRPSQSPSTRPSLAQPPSASSTSTSTQDPSSTHASRFSSLRRLSAIGRRDSGKRDRAGSSGSLDEDGEQKKRRVQEPSPAAPSIDPLTLPTPSEPLSPIIPALSSDPYPQPTSPPGSPDPLLSDRLRTLSTITNALGADWPSSTPNAATAHERLRRLLRRSLPPDASSAPNDGSPGDRRPSPLDIPPSPGPSRPDASTPSLPPPRYDARVSDTTVHESSDRALDELTTQLESARANLADAQRQLDDMDGTLANGNPETSNSAAPNPGEAGAGGNAGTNARRIPAGAVLIIQGLAQTHAIENRNGPNGSAGAEGSSGEEGGDSNTTGGGSRTRRSSESNIHESSTRSAGSSTAAEGANADDEDQSLDAQARMISGLLTVAATATATTLLAPSSSPAPAPRPSNPLSQLLERFRPHRRSAPTVEAALGNYLRSALRDRRQTDDNGSISGIARPELTRNASSSSSVGARDVPDEFQTFLEALQEDIVGAVRRYAGPGVVESESGPETGSTGTTLSSGVSSPVSPSAAATTSPGAGDTPLTRMDIDGDADPDHAPSASTPTPIPSFHHQIGQTRADDPTRRYGVSGGLEGLPRRLNFFRAHMFPPIRPSTSPATPDSPAREETGADDPDGMVPCIFVGVRSLAHDPSMTTDDLVQHPNFPFADGQVPPPSAAAEPANTATETAGEVLLEEEENHLPPSPSTPGTGGLNLPPPTSNRSNNDRPSTPMPGSWTSSEPATDRRSLRERVLHRLISRREPPPAPRTTGPLRTYLVFVIGGYYPRSHPVLSIPNLVTGGPLTDEEMALISELMGPGKPPTASRDEIANSGLVVVPATEIVRLGEQGKVLENCVERCLVCLGDYEVDEECRVLKCRHAFHKECVDHWLSEGRNSCPACRTEAVEVKKNETPTATSMPTASASASTGPSAQNDETSLSDDVD